MPDPSHDDARGWQVDEAARLAEVAAVERLAVRDSPPLQRIARFAAQLCEAPVALITLVGETEQVFLARTGTDAEGTPRDISFCQHTIAGRGLLVLPDLPADPRFADNPLVTGGPEVRFYAGVPLVTDTGAALGSLCVLDVTARPDGLTALQEEGLTILAADVVARLLDTRDAASWRDAEEDGRRLLTESETRFRTLADTMPQMVWSTRPDGFHDYYNARWYDFTGVPEGTTDGEAWNDMFHPEDQARAWETWRHSLDTGDFYEIEYRLKHFDGTYRWVLGRALPIRDQQTGEITRWFGTCTDIHEQKLAQEEREVISQELSHRIKNIFAVIAGLIGFAARSRPEFAPISNDLRQRITALGRAHDFVRPHSPNSRPSAQQDSLHGLLDDLFAPYQRAGDDRVRITGEDIAIDDRSATPIALLVHELATNATKYGALSVEEGVVAVELRTAGDEVTICWSERGGPPVTEPKGEQGFGSQLVELAAVRQLGGRVARDWRPEGLVVTVTVPQAAFSRVTT